MNSRSLTLAAAVCLALTGLSGCNRDADNIAKAPDTTTPPAVAPATPAAPPAGDATATTPPAATPPVAVTPGADGVDRTAGQTVDDAGVTAKVKAALLAESGVDGTKINVDTFNGRVTLKGEVPSKAQVDKAAQIARGVTGVKEVDNRLTASAG